MFHPIRKASVLLTLTAGATLAGGTAALAADNTRYVSISGNNANPCTLALPCRSLQRGITVTPAGGELRVLDSGFFGNNATIKKSLTISGNGNTVYLGTNINIDDASAVVALRGLVLDGQGTIADGIRITAAAAVHIERCLVHGFTGQGIRVASSGVEEVFLVDSTARDNGLFGFNGQVALRVTIDNSHFHNNNSAGVVTGVNTTIHRSTASGNNFGIFVTPGSTTSVMSTVAAQNIGPGFVVSGGSLTVDFSVAHGNGGQGLSVSIGGTARISNSTFTNNVIGIENNSSTVETRQNNIVRGNATDTSGALTPLGGV